MTPESTPTWLVGPEIPPARRIGTVLNGTYRLDAFLGQGMTGITYNAWHLRQKQPFAVKLLHRDLQPSHERVVKLRQDLRVLASLRKQGFLPVELSFAPDGAPFLASELLIGESLRERLSRGPLPSLAAGIVVAALARALGEAHKLNVVHGDLRPENVLLPSEDGREIEAGQPVLMDAALHHLRRRPIGLDESLPLHKLAYLAPEQTAGEQSMANAAGDMFALGAILYECLTGKAAFAADELEVVYEKLSQPPAKLELAKEVGAPPGLAPALDAVIAKACSRDPDDRYASMGDLLTALSNAFSGAGLPLPPADERIAIDTVQSQNRGLRKRTVAVKRIGPTEPSTAAQPQAKPASAPAVGAGKVPTGEPSKASAPVVAKAVEAKKSSLTPALSPSPAASGASGASGSDVKPVAAKSEGRTGEFKRISAATPAPVPKPVATAAAAASAPASDGKTGEFKRIPVGSASASAKSAGSGVVPVPSPAKPVDSRPSYPDAKTGEFKRVPIPGSEAKGPAVGRESAPTAAAATAASSAPVAERRTGEIKKAVVSAEAKPAIPQPASQPATVGKVVATAKGAADAAKAAQAKAASPDAAAAKARPLRRTVKARDLSGILADVAAGRLDAALAIAMAGLDEEEAEAGAAAAPAVSEEQRIIDEGRAAVLARAEAAKRNRQVEAEESAQRAQEQQRRILEQARQETLSRMRAEMTNQARPAAGAGSEEAVDPELLVEAQRQREQLEKARLEAERQAVVEEERARKEAEAAEQARLEAERVEAALRDAEQREAARAEAMRKEAEREQEARRAAESAEAERQQHLREAQEAEQLLAEARQRAEQAAREAEEARRAADAEADLIAWEEGVVEVVDQRRPPPTPAAALRQKSQAAQAAQEAAEQAEASVREASMRVDAAREQADALARTVEDAHREADEAAAAREAEAAELAKAVAAADAARARDNELLRLASAASERAQAAEAARVQHATRATRVTQALAVLQQVQDMAQSQGPSRGSAAASAPAAKAAPAASPPAGSSSGVVPVPAAAAPAAPAAPARGMEPSGIYAGYSVTDALRDPSGVQRDLSAAVRGQAPTQSTGQLPRPEFSGPYQPGQMTPALQQATQSPTRPMQVVGGQAEPPGEVVEISAMLPASSLAAMVGMHAQSQTVPMSGPGMGANPGMSPMMQPANMPLLPGMTGVTAQVPGTGPHPQLVGAPMMQQMAQMQQMPQMPMPPVDAGGVTLTVRQFVATLTVTSLLSAIIGALIVILVMRERAPLFATNGPDIRPQIGGPSPAERPTDTGSKPTPVPSPQTGSAVVASPSKPAVDVVDLATPPAVPTPAAPTNPTVPDEPSVGTSPGTAPAAVGANAYPNKRPASVRLPPLRLLTDQALVRPRPAAAPTGGGGTGGTQGAGGAGSAAQKEPAANPAPATDSKPSSGGDAKPAADTKPAADSKPASEAKPEPKKAAGDDTLRNPFGP